jgi:hypothetical protein
MFAVRLIVLAMGLPIAVAPSETHHFNRGATYLRGKGHDRLSRRGKARFEYEAL